MRNPGRGYLTGPVGHLLSWRFYKHGEVGRKPARRRKPSGSSFSLYRLQIFFYQTLEISNFISYSLIAMKVRPAKVTDAEMIYALISCYAEQEQMLFRSLSDIYENLQTFLVAEDNGNVLGCCSLQIIWKELAEIKSVAVSSSCKGKGIGKLLINAAVEQARQCGVARLFTLTLVPDFFSKLGFNVVDKQTLPMKVWKDCAKCSKQDACDEVAMVYPM